MIPGLIKFHYIPFLQILFVIIMGYATVKIWRRFKGIFWMRVILYLHAVGRNSLVTFSGKMAFHWLALLSCINRLHQIPNQRYCGGGDGRIKIRFCLLIFEATFYFLFKGIWPSGGSLDFHKFAFFNHLNMMG